MSSGGMEQEVFMNNSEVLDSRFRGNDIKEGSNLSFTSILKVRQLPQPLPISLQTPQFLLTC